MWLSRFLFIAILLTGCQGGNYPEWYVGQRNLSDCGPAVAAMAERIHKNNNVMSVSVRQFDLKGVNFFRWWNLQTIKRYLDSQSVAASYRSVNEIGKLGIYYVDTNHFVLARLQEETIFIADPLYGIYTLPLDQFTERVTGTYFIGLDFAVPDTKFPVTAQDEAPDL